MANDGRRAIIIDNGSGVFKAGFSGEEEPQVVFPSIVGRLEGQARGAANTTVYVGDEISSKPDTLKLNYPLQRGNVVDWDDFTRLCNYTFQEKLHISTAEYPILLTEPVMNPPRMREKMTEIIFESFTVPAMYIGEAAVFSLYASGKTTGLVLESGDGVTQTVPINNGQVCREATLKTDLGGRDVTDYLISLLAERGHTLANSSNREWIRKIKEQACYVAVDYQRELTSSEPETKYELPDGKEISIADEKFRCAEVLFDSSILKLECGGVHEMLYNCITKCEESVGKRMYPNICVCGGNTVFPGFVERLQNELKKVAPPSTKINLKIPLYAKYSAWAGASLLAGMSTFQSMWISRKEYEENGPAIVDAKRK